jgi:hypothetical protein
MVSRTFIRWTSLMMGSQALAPPPPLEVVLAGTGLLGGTGRPAATGLDSASASVDGARPQSWARFLLERWQAVYGYYLREPCVERRFIGLVAFLLSFVLVRAVTLMIRANIGPFHNVQVGETHVHHLVPGILTLLLVGYLWLIGVGTDSSGTGGLSAITSALYGLAAALTLDEFALWLNLKDVYWESAGRVSFDAVLVFASLLGIANFGAPFLRAVEADVSWLLRRVVRVALVSRA